MNRLRLRDFATEPDDHLPPDQFWGPARRNLSTHGPSTLDVVPDPLISSPTGCGVCSGSRTAFVANIYDWPVHECESCGLGFVSPGPTEDLLRSYYDGDYWAEYMDSAEPLYHRDELNSHIFVRQAQCFDRIVGQRRDARVLDVGAGDGTMLRILKEMGYSYLRGLEVDEANAERATELSGVRVDSGDFLRFSEGDWDAITLWAVIEHLKDPMAFMSHAATLLKPGGVVVLMTGDNSSFQARIQGTMDMWVYPPEHLFYFTRPSLEALFLNAGLESFRCRLQFQPIWKESILWCMRVANSIKATATSKRRLWRSINSNLLVAWGSRPVNGVQDFPRG